MAMVDAYGSRLQENSSVRVGWFGLRGRRPRDAESASLKWTGRMNYRNSYHNTNNSDTGIIIITRMWASAQRDGRPAEYRWHPLFNAAKLGWRPVLECYAVTLPRCETRWN